MLFPLIPSPSCRASWSPTASGTSLAYECWAQLSNRAVSKYTDPLDSYLCVWGGGG